MGHLVQVLVRAITLHLRAAVVALLVIVSLGAACFRSVSSSRRALVPAAVPVVVDPGSAQEPGAVAGPVFLSSRTAPQGFIACVAGANRVKEGAEGYNEASFMGAAISRLRDMGNTDPVLVFHVDGELSGPEISMLRSFDGVQVQDLASVLDEGDILSVKGDISRYRGFDCKIVALLHSPFPKTMVMDTDTFFFTNPARLWSHPTVKRAGTMFFLDRKTDDAGNPSPMGNVKCANIEAWANADSVKLELGVNLDKRFRIRHKSFCEGLTKHESCSSLVVVDRTHVSGRLMMDMLKKLHTGYMNSDPDGVGKWSWGDKEYYWIACELTGVACGWSPRGRPMHIFNYERQKASEYKRGCAVQVAPDGDGWDLLHGNLDYACDPMRVMLNAITVWNPNNTEPAVDGLTQSMTTGRGSRMLTQMELDALFKYWTDIRHLQLSIPWIPPQRPKVKNG